MNSAKTGYTDEAALAIIRYAISKRGTGAVIVTVNNARQLEVARQAGATHVIVNGGKAKVDPRSEN